MERGVLQGLAAFRWAACAWMALVLTLARDELRHPLLGTALVAIALAVTAAATMLWRTRPLALLRPGFVLTELGVGFSLVLLDGVVRDRGSAFTTGQSIGSVWPLVGVLSAAVAWGPVRGAVAGAVLGLGRTGSTLLNDVGSYDSGRVLSLTSTVFFYAMAAAVAGYLFALLQRAREEVASARAREEVARELHDGVLQTLALIERRADDSGLARMAREQERQLRAYLAGDREAAHAGLGAALREAAGRFEDVFGGRVQVLVADDLPALADAQVRALSGAVGEALTNAGKHGRATHVTVYAEPRPQGGVFLSVKDDGCGFDPASTDERMGLAQSVRGRVADVGGMVEVKSEPGWGTEVRMWLR